MAPERSQRYASRRTDRVLTESWDPKRSRSAAPAGGAVVEDIFTTEEILERIVVSADDEFRKPDQFLIWSGFAAGLVMSLSFLGPAALASTVEAGSGRAFASLLYPVGFIFIILGRYQLFTENTLTPVTLVLTRLAGIRRLLRIWSLVFLSNVAGAAVAGLFLARSGVLGPEIEPAALSLATSAIEVAWMDLFSRGIAAGLLVAGMVWLNHAVREGTARLIVIFVMTYVVGVGHLTHCIVGASEMFYLVFRGTVGLFHAFWSFLVPATVGNTVGGVFLVAILNYAKTPSIPSERNVLSWRKWLLAAGDPSRSNDSSD